MPESATRRRGRSKAGCGIARLSCTIGLTAAATLVGSNASAQPVILGIDELPRTAGQGGAAVGGISGIDYDPVSDRWFLISDDKSEFGRSRFWTAQISYDVDHPVRSAITATVTLVDDSGRAFGAPGQGGEAADGEAIRYDPVNKSLLWASEGDERDGVGPSVRRISEQGVPLAKLALPDFFSRDPDHRSGPRPNLSLEGLTFASDNRSLWLSLEAPVVQDGKLASALEGAFVRLSRLSPSGARILNQYAYRVEPIGPYPEGKLADNGVSEILSVDAHHLLVLERSGVEQADKDFAFRSRLYCASTKRATNVAGRQSLGRMTFRSTAKRLAFDFSKVGIRVGSVEGISWGRVLANGHMSLVVVTDNDFSRSRTNQVIAMDSGSRSRADFVRHNCPR